MFHDVSSMKDDVHHVGFYVAVSRKDWLPFITAIISRLQVSVHLQVKR